MTASSLPSDSLVAILSPLATRHSPLSTRAAFRRTSEFRPCADPPRLATPCHRSPKCQGLNGARSRRSDLLFQLCHRTGDSCRQISPPLLSLATRDKPSRDCHCRLFVLLSWPGAVDASASSGDTVPSSTLPTEFGAPLTTNQDGDEFLAHGPKTRLMGRVFIVGDVHRNAGILNIDTCHGEPANRAFPIDCRTTLRIEMFAGTIAAPPCFREGRPPVVSLLTFHVPRARSLWLGPAVCDDFQIRRHHQGFGIREATWKACRHLARPVRRVSRRKAI